MLFNSFSFLIFFPVVTALYFAAPHRWRWLLLLAASSYFYTAFIPVYILILFFTIAVDYTAGIFIEAAHGTRRKLFLVASLVANIGVLAFFKYFNFLNANLATLAQAIHWNYPVPLLDILLPIGLSFHTFQSMSYTIEVYRGKWKAERHLGILALYVMFYPQLVAGPIERPYNLLAQLHAKHDFDYNRVTDGLKLMAWGFFKKLVIADRLADFVNPVYAHPSNYPGPALILATILFAYQIYCDFSGYTDIARGAARVMGFRLMVNFDRPYSAASIGEFWRRWHISLSSWFRDYLYIPLGGNRVSPARWRVNILFVFLVSGLWHGANWTFAIWGLLHGLYFLLFDWAKQIGARLEKTFGKAIGVPRAAQIALTFGLVSFAWIFFRADSVNGALYIASHLLVGFDRLLTLGEGGLVYYLNMNKVALAAIVFLEAAQYLQDRFDLRTLVTLRPAPVRWALYYGLVMAILLLGKFSEQRFIYFQF